MKILHQSKLLVFNELFSQYEYISELISKSTTPPHNSNNLYKTQSAME